MAPSVLLVLVVAVALATAARTPNGGNSIAVNVRALHCGCLSSSYAVNIHRWTVVVCGRSMSAMVLCVRVPLRFNAEQCCMLRGDLLCCHQTTHTHCMLRGDLLCCHQTTHTHCMLRGDLLCCHRTTHTHCMLRGDLLCCHRTAHTHCL